MGFWSWLLPELNFRLDGDYLVDNGTFRYNLKKAVIASYLYSPSREAIDQDYVRNIAQQAYRTYYRYGPTEKAAAVDKAWAALGELPVAEWIEAAKPILERGNPAEMFSYLRP